MSKVEEIRQYLQTWLDLCEMAGLPLDGIMSYYSLILDKGREFQGRAQSRDYPSTASFRKLFRPKPKECYYNAQMFVLEHREGRYFEGYSAGSFIPFQHAWIVMPDGRVVDFTLDALKRRYKYDPDEVEYIGVEVPTDILRKLILKYNSSEPYAQMHYLNTECRFLLD